MEMLNRVELRGVVGNAKSQPIGDSCITKFSVCTDNVSQNKDGNYVVETVWHQIVSFDKNAQALNRGDKVYVLGRIRNQRYMDAFGDERIIAEILANKVEKLN